MRPHRLGLVVAALVLTAACGPGGDDTSEMGTEGGACYGNGTCNEGLTCVADRCRLVAADGGTPVEDGGVQPTDGGTEDGGTTQPDGGTPGPDHVAAAVAPGGTHTCALTSGGGLLCWGGNGHGELGDRSNTERHEPTPVFGLGAGVTQVSSGGHTCAVVSGGLKCWGLNDYGQLGTSNTQDRSSPADVVGLGSGVRSVSGRYQHTCAVTTGGALKCWGYDSDGQLGTGGTTWDPVSHPLDVLSSGVASVSTGATHTCAVMTSGAAKCWGYNYDGAVGDGTNTSRDTPVDVFGLTSGVKAISAGAYSTCAVTSAGAAMCWGSNDSGLLGDGTTTNRNQPTPVSGLGHGVAAVTVGSDHACARTTSGGVKCWGNNDNGQLGDGTIVDRHTPVDVVGLSSGVKAVEAGPGFTCALLTSGSLRCWGANAFGRLGDGTTEARTAPVTVSGF